MANGDSGQLFQVIMQVPGAKDALAFLQREAAAFTYLPVRFERIRDALTAVLSSATDRGDQATAGQAQVALDGLGKLQSSYAAAAGDVSDVLTSVQGGAVEPLGLVPKLVGAAAKAAAVFKGTDVFEEGANTLATRTLTPAELARLRAGGSTVAALVSSPAVKIGLVIGGVWLLGRLFRRRRG